MHMQHSATVLYNQTVELTLESRLATSDPECVTLIVFLMQDQIAVLFEVLNKNKLLHFNNNNNKFFISDMYIHMHT